jgi:hypothetical protein
MWIPLHLCRCVGRSLRANPVNVSLTRVQSRYEEAAMTEARLAPPAFMHAIQGSRSVSKPRETSHSNRPNTRKGFTNHDPRKCPTNRH